jgi:hypothetical protein
MWKQDGNFFHFKLKKQHFIENNYMHRYTYKHLMKQQVSEKNFLSKYLSNYGLMSRKT